MGLVSFMGTKCGVGAPPTVFTDIKTHQKFINNCIASNVPNRATTPSHLDVILVASLFLILENAFNKVSI